MSDSKLRMGAAVHALATFMLCARSERYALAGHIKHWHDNYAEGQEERAFLRGAYYFLMDDHNVEPERVEDMNDYVDAARLIDAAEPGICALFNRRALEIALEHFRYSRTRIEFAAADGERDAQVQLAILDRYRAELEDCE